MKKKLPDKEEAVNLETSITEAALDAVWETYEKDGDLVLDGLKQHKLGVRDFMVLSFVCDQGHMDVEQLVRSLGITDITANNCIDRLYSNGLISRCTTKEGLLSICSTPEGKAFIAKANEANQPDD
jgi:DNA-binding MarR family transcriptional regulator